MCIRDSAFGLISSIPIGCCLCGVCIPQVLDKKLDAGCMDEAVAFAEGAAVPDMLLPTPKEVRRVGKMSLA
eukprot:6717668-Alexandrium_andersonii.AAC.1